MGEAILELVGPAEPRGAGPARFWGLAFTVADIDQNGPTATANVVATAANGATASQPIQFVQGPSPTGWQVTKSSAMTLLTSAS